MSASLKVLARAACAALSSLNRRVAQLVVRREHHQNVHGYLDFWLPRRSRFGGSRVAVASRAGIQSRSSRRNAGLASEPRARLDRYQLRETSRRTGSEPVSRG